MEEFKRFKELLLKKGSYTDHECAEIVTLAYNYAYKFRDEEEVQRIIAMAKNRCVMNFRELLKHYHNDKGVFIKALHPFTVDYRVNPEGTVSDKLKS